MSQISPHVCCDPPKQPLKSPPSLFSRLLPREFGKEVGRNSCRLRFLETYVTTGRAGWKVTKNGVLASGVACREWWCWIPVDHGESNGDIYEAHPLPPKRPEVKGLISWGGVALGGGFPLDSDEWRRCTCDLPLLGS